MKAHKLFIELLFIVLIVFTMGHAMAQSMAGMRNATPEQRAAYQTNMMKTKLHLDTQQLVKTSAINLKYAKKFQPIIKGSGDRKERLKQAEALQDAKDLELKTVFTKEQFATYTAYENQLKNSVMAKVGKLL